MEFEVDEGAPGGPLEQMIGWARSPGTTRVSEDALPAPMRDALASARVQRAPRTLSPVAFQTLVDGAQVARMGPDGELPPHGELVALSVIVSEATVDGVHVVAHVLVARAAG
jgi:hypothetical protein